jgi:hypothetical protein
MKFDKILPNNIWKIKKQKQDIFLCILEKNKLRTFLATKHDTWSLDSFQKIKKCKEKKLKKKSVKRVEKLQKESETPCLYEIVQNGKPFRMQIMLINQYKCRIGTIKLKFTTTFEANNGKKSMLVLGKPKKLYFKRRNTSNL